MAETIPPWLTRDYDPVGTFMKSYQIGASIQNEQNRLAQAQQAQAMEAQAKREALTANIFRAQAELQADQAYKQQQLELHNRELEETKKRNADLAAKALMDLQERSAYHQMLATQRAGKSGEATIVTHPEIPGMKFLRNPSGAETPVQRPEKDMTPQEKYRLGLTAYNAMAPRANELETDPSYQARTNFAGGVLRAVAPPSETKAAPQEAKLTLAKKLRAQHPDWSKQDIIDEVNRQIK